MLELILQIAGFLIAASVIGLFAGYLVWGWGQRERIETARADGAARARTSVGGDPALETQVKTLTTERNRLARSVESLKAEIAGRAEDHPNGDAASASAINAETDELAGPDAPEPRPPVSLLRRSRDEQGAADKTGARESDSPGRHPAFGRLDHLRHQASEAPLSDGDALPEDDGHDDHAIPASFGDRPGRSAQASVPSEVDKYAPDEAEDSAFMDADIEQIDDDVTRLLGNDDPAGQEEIEAAINDILDSVQTDDGETAPGRSRLFGRAVAPEDETSETVMATEDAGNQTADPADSANDAPNAATDMPPGFYPAPPDEIDDLKKIRGVGKKMEALLNSNGVYQFRQIAGLNEDDIEWLSKAIQSFPGRIRGDDWVGQAEALHRQTHGTGEET